MNRKIWLIGLCFLVALWTPSIAQCQSRRVLKQIAWGTEIPKTQLEPKDKRILAKILERCGKIQDSSWGEEKCRSNRTVRINGHDVTLSENCYYVPSTTFKTVNCCLQTIYQTIEEDSDSNLTKLQSMPLGKDALYIYDENSCFNKNPIECRESWDQHFENEIKEVYAIRLLRTKGYNFHTAQSLPKETSAHKRAVQQLVESCKKGTCSFNAIHQSLALDPEIIDFCISDVTRHYRAYPLGYRHDALYQCEVEVASNILTAKRILVHTVTGAFPEETDARTFIAYLKANNIHTRDSAKDVCLKVGSETAQILCMRAYLEIEAENFKDLKN